MFTWMHWNWNASTVNYEEAEKKTVVFFSPRVVICVLSFCLTSPYRTPIHDLGEAGGMDWPWEHSLSLEETSDKSFSFGNFTFFYLKKLFLLLCVCACLFVCPRGCNVQSGQKRASGHLTLEYKQYWAASWGFGELKVGPYLLLTMSIRIFLFC